MARLCGFIAFLAIAAASALIYQVAAEPEQSCSSVNDENGGDAVAAAAAATASSGTVALAVAQAAAARSWGEAAGIVLNELVPLDLPCGDKDPMLAGESPPDQASKTAPQGPSVDWPIHEQSKPPAPPSPPPAPD